MRQFHVIIVGGGLGGLTLAQGLKKNGISCAVYEKDLSRADRLQGYRIVFPTLLNIADSSYSATTEPTD
jgi:2-polyprenyl-6-methoxyphenol hydroxylase-like FAD-dependent oxidoreductase